MTDSGTYRGRMVVVDEIALKQGKVPQELTRVLSLPNRLLDSKVPTPRNGAPELTSARAPRRLLRLAQALQVAPPFVRQAVQAHHVRIPAR